MVRNEHASIISETWASNGHTGWQLCFAKERGVRIAPIETDSDSNSQRNEGRAGGWLEYVAVQMTRAYKHSEV